MEGSITMRFRASTVSPQRLRAHYVLTIKGVIVDTIFLEFDKERYENLYELLQENALMLDGTSPTFAYKNQMYAPLGYRLSKEDNRAIHPALLQRVIDYFDRIDFDLIVQRNRIDNYIGNILLFSKHISDVKAILPHRFHKPILEVDLDIFNIGNEASVEEIEDFKERNRVGIVELQRLFLTDLLML